jgi:hypothetical protein
VKTDGLGDERRGPQAAAFIDILIFIGSGQHQ